MKSTQSPVASTSDDGCTQTLSDHLVTTAEKEAEFASPLGCPEWAYLASLWRDLGKYSPEFQRYILSSADSDAHLEGTKAGRVNHSTAGAVLAVERFHWQEGFLPI